MRPVTLRPGRRTIATASVVAAGFAAGSVAMAASLLAGSAHAFDDRVVLQGQDGGAVTLDGAAAASVTPLDAPSPSPTGSPTAAARSTVARLTPTASHKAAKPVQAPTTTHHRPRYTPPPVVSAGS